MENQRVMKKKGKYNCMLCENMSQESPYKCRHYVCKQYHKCEKRYSILFKNIDSIIILSRLKQLKKASKKIKGIRWLLENRNKYTIPPKYLDVYMMNKK